MNMTNTDTTNSKGDTQMNGIWNSPNNRSTQRSTQERLLEDSKPRREKDERPEDQRLDQQIKLKHYCTTQCVHYQTQGRKY